MCKLLLLLLAPCEKTKSQSCLHVPLIQQLACSMSMYALFTWHACMYVYTTSVQSQFDIYKATSNCNVQVDQTLSSSSKDVTDIYNGLAVIDKTSVAATC